jgi:acetylglutamate kinase
VRVDGAVQPAIAAEDVEPLIELGTVGDGMAAKLRAARAALRGGARAVRIGDPGILDDPAAGTRILAAAVQPV